MRATTVPMTYARRCVPSGCPAIAASPPGGYRAGASGSEPSSRRDRSGDTAPAADGRVDAEASGVDREHVGEASDIAGAAAQRALEAAEEVAALDLAGLSDAQLEAHISRLRRPLAVLEAARARALSEMEQRVRQTADPGRVTGQLLENRRRVPLG